MAGNGWLTPSNINEVFKELDRSLEKEGEHVEMYVAGGARMILGLRTDRVTEDVDRPARLRRRSREMTNSICVPTRLVTGWETNRHASGEITKRVNGTKPVVL